MRKKRAKNAACGSEFDDGSEFDNGSEFNNSAVKFAGVGQRCEAHRESCRKLLSFQHHRQVLMPRLIDHLRNLEVFPVGFGGIR